MIHDADLFARLRGQTARASIADSIRYSLQWLLNSRKGFLPHIKDYGIRDLADLRNERPREELLQEIKSAIEKYEPRIKKILIEEIELKEESRKHFFAVFKMDIELQDIYGENFTLIYGFDFEGKAQSVED